MPATVTDIDTLRDYISRVTARAEHHANNVDEICLAIIGAVVWRKDPGTDLEVMERDGDMKNVLWVRISGRRYALSYNHTQQTIEVREGTTRGTVLHSFSNSTPPSQVKRAFAGL